MGIHQISVTYQLDEDRLLMRLRTHEGELLELWFTRRLMARLWTPLQKSADRISLRGASTSATVLPEAQSMMAQAMREESRKAGNFSEPFDESARTRPLGDRPALIQSVTIQEGGENASVNLKFKDTQGREVGLDLAASMLHNLMSLIEQALRRTEWGLADSVALPSEDQGEAANRPRVLN